MDKALDITAWRTLAEELCTYRTGVNTPENTDMFQRLCQELPFTVHEYPADTECNGWVAPQRWHVEKAIIKRDGGIVIFDGLTHALGVAALSHSFTGTLNKEELDKHIVTSAQLPDAYIFHCMWQYRPWATDWAISVPWNTLQHWGSGCYDVELVTCSTLDPMQVAEYTHHGESPQTFVLQAHTCHPGQAEDGFGAVAVLVKFFQQLQGRKTRYTYKLLLGPEHVGTVFWIKDKTREELELLCGGCFMEMPGVEAPLKLGSSLMGHHYIDKVMKHILRHYAEKACFVPWRRGAGNDETVWEAPGYEVPFTQLTRSRGIINHDCHYEGYHSSLDIPAQMNGDNVAELFAILNKTIDVLEHNSVPLRCFDGLICLSNPTYDLYAERFDPAIAKDISAFTEKLGTLQDYLLRYFDGSMTLLDIADRHDLPFDCIYELIQRYAQKKLVILSPAPLQRPPISLRADSIE